MRIVKGNKNALFIIDVAGLFLIGIFFLLYCMFGALFAERHIKVSFLDFPVFFGEILLFLCTILLIMRWKVEKKKFNIWHYLLFCYFGFILLKVFLGYYKWGPLALRDAALFYYPLFAVFSYNFYEHINFNNKINLFLAILMICILWIISVSHYFLLTWFILSLIFIKEYQDKVIKSVLIGALLFLFPYGYLFNCARTILVSNLTSGVFLIVALFVVIRLKTIYKVTVFVFFWVFVLTGILRVADRSAVISIISMKENYDQYKLNDAIVAQKEKDFKMLEIKEVKLYNPDIVKDEMIVPRPYPIELGQVVKAKSQISDKMYIVENKYMALKDRIEILQPGTKKTTKLSLEELEIMMKTIENQVEHKTNGEIDTSKIVYDLDKVAEKIKILDKSLRKIEKKAREKSFPDILRMHRGNILFRIFIWRDKIREVKKNFFLGIDFGKPFRSKSIEIMGWAEGEWIRDGWITAHNSYIEIIYRAGTLGVLFVIIIFVMFFKMVLQSVKLKSVNGVLLCGALINLIVAANFALVLELPYNAIPFWGLFGVTFCYLKLKKQRINESINNT